MFDNDYLELFTQLSGFKVLVLANRLGCDNDLARRAHDQLLTELAKLIHMTRQVLAAQRNMVLGETTEDCLNATEDRVWIGEVLAERCESGEQVQLLDDLIVDDATNEYYDEELERWRFIDGDSPWLDELSDTELCGLDRILDDIAAETGLCFTACRINYDLPGTPPEDLLPDDAPLSDVGATP
jgi:hypothetical protein